jgi:hypothetical protein
MRSENADGKLSLTPASTVLLDASTVSSRTLLVSLNLTTPNSKLLSVNCKPLVLLLDKVSAQLSLWLLSLGECPASLPQHHPINLNISHFQ